MGLGRLCIPGVLYPFHPVVLDFTRLCQVDTWVVAPYKKPEHDIPDNEEFNNHVSMVRIQFEHTIEFLKGHFHSLKHLQLRISNERSHKFATLDCSLYCNTLVCYGV